MQKWPYRCSRCGARRTLPRPEEQYKRVPKCKMCGGYLRLDKYRKHKEHTRNVCRCGHYPYPHRKKSLWCQFGVMGRLGISYFDRDRPEVQALLSKREEERYMGDNQTIAKVELRPYECDECGHEFETKTNHYGAIYWCPLCGTGVRAKFTGEVPEGFDPPAEWTKTTLGDLVTIGPGPANAVEGD